MILISFPLSKKITLYEKIITTFIISLLSLFAFSQTKGIKCVYATVYPVKQGFYELENQYVRETMLARAKADRKIYSLTAVNGIYLCTKEPTSVDKMPLMVDPRNIYVDLNDSVKVTQTAYDSKLYLVKGRASELDWDIEDKAETVLGKTCYKATLKQNPNIMAWFTPDIPFACGPLGYYGLPGLVVRMTTPNYTLNLESMTEVDNVELKEPTEGEHTTEDDYSKKIDRNYKKLLESADKVTYIE